MFTYDESDRSAYIASYGNLTIELKQSKCSIHDNLIKTCTSDMPIRPREKQEDAKPILCSQIKTGEGEDHHQW